VIAAANWGRTGVRGCKRGSHGWGEEPNLSYRKLRSTMFGQLRTGSFPAWSCSRPTLSKHRADSVPSPKPGRPRPLHCQRASFFDLRGDIYHVPSVCCRRPYIQSEPMGSVGSDVLVSTPLAHSSAQESRCKASRHLSGINIWLLMSQATAQAQRCFKADYPNHYLLPPLPLSLQSLKPTVP
jgi:hypothetical protein